MVITKTKEEQYLLALVDCALNSKNAPYPTDVDMGALLKLADKQQVYSLVLPVLSEGRFLSEAELRAWKNHQLSDLQKTIMVDNERNMLCSELDEHGINYMFLKGLVVRAYYPKTSMRQMGDNDILYDESRRDDLLKIMKKHGFHLDAVSESSDDFIKYPVTMEFHRKLFNPDPYFSFPLNVWERASRFDNSHRWLINKEDNYLYSLAHSYKHYLYGGCTLRVLCDDFVLRKNVEYDTNYINTALKELNLEDFHSAVTGLCDCLFEGKDANAAEQKLLNVIFGREVIIREHESFRPDMKEGKLRYFVKRIFPGKQFMIWSFPVLEKRPYLLPFYYIKRLLLRAKYGRKNIEKEITKLKK